MRRSSFSFQVMLLIFCLTAGFQTFGQEVVHVPLAVEFRDAQDDRIRSDGRGTYLNSGGEGEVVARIDGRTGLFVFWTCDRLAPRDGCRANSMRFDQLADDLLGDASLPESDAPGLPFVEKLVQAGWTVSPLGRTTRLGLPFLERLESGPKRMLANLKLNFRESGDPSILWTIRKQPNTSPDSHSLLLTILGGSLDCRNGCSTFTLESLDYSFPEANPECCHTGQIEDVGTLISQGVGIFDEGDYHLPFKMRVTVQRDESQPRHYYLPWVDAQRGRFTGLAISNPSHMDASLKINAYGKNGQEIESKKLELRAGKQWARLVSEIFSEGESFSGWIEVISDNPGVGMFVQSGDSGLSTLDGVTPFEAVYRKLYFLRAYAGPEAFRKAEATTMINIINPTEARVRARLRTRTASGETVSGITSEVEIDLPAKGTLTKPYSDLFAGEISSGYLELEVVEGDGLIAFQRVILSDHETEFALKAASWEDGGDLLYSGQFARIPSVLFSSFRLLNTSPEVARVELTPVDASGVSSAQPKSIEIGPGELLEQEVQQLLNPLAAEVDSPSSAGQFIGSLRVSVEGGGWGVLGDVVFGLDDLGYAAASSLQRRALTTTVFTHVASLPNAFFTGLAILNPQAEPVTVEISCFSAEGDRTAHTSLELGPGQRISGLLTDLFPSAPEQVGGYLKLIATRPIIAQELFGTPSLSLLSAVQPIGE